MVRNICSSTVESKDYDKFTTAIANVLFKKVYIEEEVWNPGMVAGLINIVLEVLDVQEVNTSFAPANSMLGQEDTKVDSLRETIIEKFNKNVAECEHEEIREYRIGIE